MILKFPLVVISTLITKFTQKISEFQYPHDYET